MRAAGVTSGPPLRVGALDVVVEGARLLHRVDLEASQGGLVGLIGPNGAGKSTLLRAIAGLIGREGGAVQVEGDDLARLSPREVARRLALVSQHAPETHGFSSLELVLTGRYPHLGRLEVEGARDREIAEEAMRRTSTEAFAERAVSSLSGGERQRVFIARGLAQQTPILLLDEPTSSLDVRHQLATFDLLHGLAGDGLTIIVAVHDLDLAARYCDRLVMLQGGRVVADGTPEEVLDPTLLASVFGAAATTHTDPVTGTPRVTFTLRPAEHPAKARA